MRFKRIKNFFNLKSDAPMPVDKQEIYNIVTKMCYHSQSILLVAPYSERYFIENRQLNYFVVITLDGIRITNHKFDREIVLELHYLEDLIDIFIKKVEEKRHEMEEEIFGNSLLMLQAISKSLDEPEVEL